ncbi:hypothetical protein OUZ56_009883 [Daphnia magna]|uniref:Uncharacterized protein n=1 Tax=Daphnia magna TaxID=35525 RepID=A0ABR0AHD9_9CRUS|nr:hypothetical protein OUZ56_009883 [Daphnia magna]
MSGLTLPNPPYDDFAPRPPYLSLKRWLFQNQSDTVRVHSTLLCLNVALATQDVFTFSNASGKQARTNVLKRSALLCSKLFREQARADVLVQPALLSNKSYELSRLFVEPARAKALDDSTLLFAYHK